MPRASLQRACNGRRSTTVRRWAAGRARFDRHRKSKRSRYPLDNNIAEAGFVGLALGRRNYVGCRSERGMTVATTVYTLFESARVCGATPDEYRRGEDVLSDAVGVSRLFASSRLPGPPRKKRSRSVGDLKGCDVIRLSNAIGSSTPGAHEALAIDALHDVAFGNCDHLGASIRNTLSGLNPIHGRAATPVHSTSSAFSPSAPTTSSPPSPLGSIRGALARAYLGGIRPA